VAKDLGTMREAGTEIGRVSCRNVPFLVSFRGASRVRCGSSFILSTELFRRYEHQPALSWTDSIAARLPGPLGTAAPLCRRRRPTDNLRQQSAELGTPNVRAACEQLGPDAIAGRRGSRGRRLISCGEVSREHRPWMRPLFSV
jgi:LSD1 subclass zinc finger protein